MIPKRWGQGAWPTEPNLAVTVEPARTVAVRCNGPELPSSLQAKFGSFKSLIGSLHRKVMKGLQENREKYVQSRPAPLNRGLIRCIVWVPSIVHAAFNPIQPYTTMSHDLLQKYRQSKIDDDSAGHYMRVGFCIQLAKVVELFGGNCCRRDS